MKQSFFNLANLLFSKPENYSKKHYQELVNYINLCHTINDIEATRMVLQDSIHQLSTEDFKTVLYLLNYQTELILYNNKHLTRNLYPSYEIAKFLKTATYFQCDAVLLHLDQNKVSYQNHRNNLDHYKAIFNRMVDKRKNELIAELHKYAS